MRSLMVSSFCLILIALCMSVTCAALDLTPKARTGQSNGEMMSSVLSESLVTASPSINVPIRRISSSKLTPFAKEHLARSRRYTLASLSSTDFDVFLAEVSIGTPPQKFMMILDTGSSTTAIAGPQIDTVSPVYDPEKSSTAVNKGRQASITYGTGGWQGNVYQDIIGFTGSVTVSAEFVVITSQTQFFFEDPSPNQGILGLSFKSLAIANILPFFDELVRHRGVSNVFSFAFCEDTGDDFGQINEGQLWIGGYNKEYFQGELQWIPISKAMYYAVHLQDIQIDGKSIKIDPSVYNTPRTMFDTGTTSLILPKSAFDQVVSTLKSYRNDLSEDFWLAETCALFSFPSLIFPSIDLLFDTNEQFSTLTLKPNQYLRSCRENELSEDQRRSSSNDALFWRFNIVTFSAYNFGTIIGAGLFRGMYIVHDRVQKRIGFAPVIECNIPDSPVQQSPYFRLSDTCALPGMPDSSCEEECSSCTTSSSRAFCRSGSATLTLNGTKYDLWVTGGYCWPGSPFSFKSQQVSTVLYGYGDVVIDVYCDDIPQWLQCSVSGSAAIALGVIIIVLLLVIFIGLLLACKRICTAPASNYEAVENGDNEHLLGGDDLDVPLDTFGIVPFPIPNTRPEQSTNGVLSPNNNAEDNEEILAKNG